MADLPPSVHASASPSASTRAGTCRRMTNIPDKSGIISLEDVNVPFKSFPGDNQSYINASPGATSEPVKFGIISVEDAGYRSNSLQRYPRIQQFTEVPMDPAVYRGTHGSSSLQGRENGRFATL